jgi:hypothetical protein
MELGWDQRELRARVPAHDGRSIVRSDDSELGLQVLGREARQDRVRLADADWPAQLDDRIRDAATALVHEEVGVARQDPAVLGDEQAELVRVAVALVEQVRRRDVIALILDGGVEHRHKPVDDVGLHPLDKRRDRLGVGRLRCIMLGLPADQALQIADGADHDPAAAVRDRLTVLVPAERAAAHPAKVDGDLRVEGRLLADHAHSSPRATDS